MDRESELEPRGERWEELARIEKASRVGSLDRSPEEGEGEEAEAGSQSGDSSQAG